MISNSQIDGELQEKSSSLREPTFLQQLHRLNTKIIVTLAVLAASQFFFIKLIADAGELTSQALLDCTNRIRAENGLNPLYFNNSLSLAAANKLEDMEYYDYWAHKNPLTGQGPWDFVDETGYYYLTMGENLAIGFTDSQQVCEAWVKSPTHYANLVNHTFQEIGFAIDKANLHENGKGLLVVQMFGSRENFTPPAITAYTGTDHIKYPSENLTDVSNRIESGNASGKVAGETTESNPINKLWNILSGNILLFVVISAYFIIRTVVICKKEREEKTKKRCSAILIVFLLLTCASATILYLTNFSPL